MRIGIGIGDLAGAPASVGELVAQVQRAEADGFHSAWFANIFGVDALTAVAVSGVQTSRIALGTGVVPTYPRHPHALAQQAATVNAAIGHRLTLGIGLSHQVVIEQMFGLSYAKSYSHMREYLAALMPLVNEGRVKYAGERFRLNASLQVPEQRPLPVLVAALAPKMLALAGRVAAGTITWMVGEKTLSGYTVPTIRAAAEDAGRPTPRVVAGLPIAVTDDPDAARKTCGERFAVYGGLPSYRAMLDREGVEGPGGVALVGNEAEVGERLDALSAAGVTELIAAPFAVEGGDDTIARTRALLVERAG